MFRIVVIIALVAAAILLIRLHVAAAQRAATEELGANVSAGSALAQVWCAECHAIAPDSTWRPNLAPEFVAIANRPETTALALKVFLRSDHSERLMPNFIIGPQEADDLVAYILSLKRR
jgi:mono/diheme cytochrome c family protein